MMGVKSIIYERNNNRFVVNVSNDSTLEYDEELFPLDNKLVMNYVMSILSITEDWKEEYLDTSLIDSDEWKLVITYTNGNIKEYKGTGSYPDNFSSLENINDRLLDEVRHV